MFRGQVSEHPAGDGRVHHRRVARTDHGVRGAEIRQQRGDGVPRVAPHVEGVEPLSVEVGGDTRQVGVGAREDDHVRVAGGGSRPPVGVALERDRWDASDTVRFPARRGPGCQPEERPGGGQLEPGVKPRAGPLDPVVVEPREVVFQHALGSPDPPGRHRREHVVDDEYAG